MTSALSQISMQEMNQRDRRVSILGFSASLLFASSLPVCSSFLSFVSSSAHATIVTAHGHCSLWPSIRQHAAPSVIDITEQLRLACAIFHDPPAQTCNLAVIINHLHTHTHTHTHTYRTHTHIHCGLVCMSACANKQNGGRGRRRGRRGERRGRSNHERGQ